MNSGYKYVDYNAPKEGYQISYSHINNNKIDNQNTNTITNIYFYKGIAVEIRIIGYDENDYQKIKDIALLMITDSIELN